MVVRPGRTTVIAADQLLITGTHSTRFSFDQPFRLGLGQRRRDRNARLALRAFLLRPEGQGGWNYEGDSRFTVSAIRAEIRRIQGHPSSPTRLGNPDPLESAPPAGFVRRSSCFPGPRIQGRR